MNRIEALTFMFFRNLGNLFSVITQVSKIVGVYSDKSLSALLCLIRVLIGLITVIPLWIMCCFIGLVLALVYTPLKAFCLSQEDRDKLKQVAEDEA